MYFFVFYGMYSCCLCTKTPRCKVTLRATQFYINEYNIIIIVINIIIILKYKLIRTFPQKGTTEINCICLTYNKMLSSRLVNITQSSKYPVKIKMNTFILRICTNRTFGALRCSDATYGTI